MNLAGRPISGKQKSSMSLYATYCLWSGRRDSNSRHSAWKADSLPTEILPLAHSIIAWAPPIVNLT